MGWVFLFRCLEIWLALSCKELDKKKICVMNFKQSCCLQLNTSTNKFFRGCNLRYVYVEEKKMHKKNVITTLVNDHDKDQIKN